ncbi:unnamed protein product [Rotaria magnacalcarata]|uniref:Glycosyltransferase n=1 Tax=Rotaria magnacalcarata TaxID=392030 RepID=A0A819FAK2_9BILA|nr:unnamed protein product [Rotaria magnacalcarata]
MSKVTEKDCSDSDDGALYSINSDLSSIYSDPTEQDSDNSESDLSSEEVDDESNITDSKQQESCGEDNEPPTKKLREARSSVTDVTRYDNFNYWPLFISALTDACNITNGINREQPRILFNVSEILVKLRGQVVPFPEETFEGRGIVLTVGFAQASNEKVSLKMIELSGTKLPVQIWYSSSQRSHGNMLDLLRIVPKLNASVCCFETAQCRTLTSVLNLNATYVYKPLAPNLPYRTFPYKPAAIISATFAEVLFLDIDAYLVRNPDNWFWSDPMYLHFGALFFPDAILSRQHPAVWNIFNTICGHDEFEFDSSVVLVDKARVWKGLYMTKLMNDHHQIFYGSISDGDKDTFRLGFRYMQVKYYLVVIPCSTGSFNGTHFAGYTLCKTDSLSQHIYVNHLHLFKYLTIPQNSETLRYTRIGIGDPNNHSFVFQHCSTSAGPYAFQIHKVINHDRISNRCINRKITSDEVKNYTYIADEPLITDWFQYDRVMIAETSNVMPNFLKNYLKIQ